MARHRIGSWSAAARSLFVALATGLALVACGGGGGGDGEAAPAPAQTFQGNWQLAVRVQGSTGAGVAVPASTVPTQEAVAKITTASVAQMFSSNAFQGYTVTLNGTTATITGSGTNYRLVINSIAATNYQGCGACGVGGRVSYDVNMNYTESGTFNGQVVPLNTSSITVTFIYTRVS